LNPKNPKGIIIINHGFNGHIQKLKQMGYYFSNLGYDSIGYDTRGFGKSEGYKGFIHE
jgi:acylglycerol lipase